MIDWILLKYNSGLINASIYLIIFLYPSSDTIISGQSIHIFNPDIKKQFLFWYENSRFVLATFNYQ